MPECEAKGFLTFSAIQTIDGDRVTYMGLVPVYNLFEQNFVAAVASEGLSPEILKNAAINEPVQRKTSPGHVQAILDYIAAQAERGEPWAFNSIVLYSTEKLDFRGETYGFQVVGEARASQQFSVGEGLHRCLAWAVALGIAEVKGVKRPEISPAAMKRIEQATIPALVIQEPDLRRQTGDFNKLNQQKPLSATVLNLTDDTTLSALTRTLISDVALFRGRIDLNNASVGPKSDKLLSFSQLRFVVASYLLGRKTRSPSTIEQGIKDVVAKRGAGAIRKELGEVFTKVALGLGGLERLHKNTHARPSGEVVRTLRAKTLLASNAAWRALFVALHEAKVEGVSIDEAVERLQANADMSWGRRDAFFVGSLIDTETGKLLSNRESIDAASDRLRDVMLGVTASAAA